MTNGRADEQPNSNMPLQFRISDNLEYCVEPRRILCRGKRADHTGDVLLAMTWLCKAYFAMMVYVYIWGADFVKIVHVYGYTWDFNLSRAYVCIWGANFAMRDCQYT